jgi:hypothetical protein
MAPSVQEKCRVITVRAATGRDSGHVNLRTRDFTPMFASNVYPSGSQPFGTRDRRTIAGVARGDGGPMALRSAEACIPSGEVHRTGQRHP